VNSSGGPAAESGPVAKTPVQHWIPVPENPPNILCPICQEKFEMKWLDDAQEFVWMDATEIGDRIYHFSCHAEARGDGGNTPALSRGTPDSESILGKRKNEVCKHLI
jgi:pre-mRNA cleavage complex 2 protein Pcf11